MKCGSKLRNMFRAQNFSIGAAEANAWLTNFAERNLPAVRSCSLDTCDYADKVTVVGYFFFGEKPYFNSLEFSLWHTMRLLGKMPIVLVVNKTCSQVEEFKERYGNVRIEIESSLIPGGTETMSYDCIHRLHKRFDTDYCLIVQNDGFPLRGGLDEFLYRHDYVGAPISWKAALTMGYFPAKFVQNGGFSLRSRRYCEFVSKWAKNQNETEDWAYSLACWRHPIAALKNGFRVAPEAVARKFSTLDLMGRVDVSEVDSLGIHGATAIWQKRQDLSQLGYAV